MNPLPKNPGSSAWDIRDELPGVVLAQPVRCGKPTCRCASGNPDDRHGPYHYRFWREDGRLRKAYVRPEDLAATRAACERRRTRECEESRSSRLVRAALQDCRDLVREAEARLSDPRDR